MSSIKSATRRLRSIKGSCFLTHGADSYDKHGMKKAVRQMSKEIVSEQLENHPESFEIEMWWEAEKLDEIEFLMNTDRDEWWD